MSNADFALTADADFDDLPRTLRRERDLREREKRARAERDRLERVTPSETPRPRNRGDNAPDLLRSDASLHVTPSAMVDVTAGVCPSYPASTVKRLDIPFVHLMAFFLKAVVAAVPALVLLGAILWAMGQALKLLFPWLVKMQIFIQFPN